MFSPARIVRMINKEHRQDRPLYVPPKGMMNLSERLSPSLLNKIAKSHSTSFWWLLFLSRHNTIWFVSDTRWRWETWNAHRICVSKQREFKDLGTAANHENEIYYESERLTQRMLIIISEILRLSQKHCNIQIYWVDISSIVTYFISSYDALNWHEIYLIVVVIVHCV
jgi:hypothetical protein